MLHRRFRTVILVAMFALLAPRVSHAAPDKAKAKVLYEQAMQHYNVGEFDEAAKLFIDAYKAAPDPTFLYNTAQAYRLGGNHQKALFFYKSYLRDAPNAANREEVEKRIEQLKLIQEPPSETKPPEGTTTPPDGTTTPPDETPPDETPGKLNKTVPESAVDPTPPPVGGEDTARPIYKKWWFWTGIAVVAVGVTATVIVMSGDDGGIAATELGDVGPGASQALGVRF